jgi:hypothetical protein
MRSNSSSPGSRLRRSNLFVVRIWREDIGSTTGSTTDSAERTGKDDGSEQWRGRIQRAVSGEEHSFRGWSDLIELLEGMLSDKPPRPGR